MPYQQRVIEEQSQLNDRINKLDDFTLNLKFDQVNLTEQIDMLYQLRVMREYEEVLKRKIQRWIR